VPPNTHNRAAAVHVRAAEQADRAGDSKRAAKERELAAKQQRFADLGRRRTKRTDEALAALKKLVSRETRVRQTDASN
jgi:hypothetical protein